MNTTELYQLAECIATIDQIARGDWPNNKQVDQKLGLIELMARSAAHVMAEACREAVLADPETRQLLETLTRWETPASQRNLDAGNASTIRFLLDTL